MCVTLDRAQNPGYNAKVPILRSQVVRHSPHKRAIVSSNLTVGTMKHEWINPNELGFKNLGSYLSCRKCALVQNKRNKDRDDCRGKVRVTLR